MNNKWISGFLPVLLMHLSVGTIYAYTMFSTALAEHFGCDYMTIKWSFSLAIFMLGMSASIGGYYIEQNVRRWMIIGSCFFISGLIGSAVCIFYESLIGFIFFYGVIQGIGLGICYLAPVKTLLMWFKNKEGLASGLAIMGFGLASSLATPLINFLLSANELHVVFTKFAMIYVVPLIVSCVIIKPFKDVLSKKKHDAVAWDKGMICMWGIMFVNITAGLILIGSARPMLEGINLDSNGIVFVVGVMGLLNGLGRFSIATITDYTKQNLYVYIFFASLIMVLVNITDSNGVWLIILLFVVSSLYGGGFSLLPATLNKVYGVKNISQIHGKILSAWGCAGIASNLIKSSSLDMIALMYSSGLMITLYFVYLQKKK